MAQQPGRIDERMRKEYETFEKGLATASDNLVSSQSFAEALAMLTSNLMALSRAATIGADQMVRMSRLAGRNDIARLGRQIARTEDKLEHVLQVVEQLEDELARTRAERAAQDDRKTEASRAGDGSNGSGSGSGSSGDGAGSAARTSAGRSSR